MEVEVEVEVEVEATSSSLCSLHKGIALLNIVHTEVWGGGWTNERSEAKRSARVPVGGVGGGGGGGSGNGDNGERTKQFPQHLGGGDSPMLKPCWALVYNDIVVR